MLFAFRGIRFFQAIVALVALVAAVGAVFALKGFSDDGNPLLLPAAVVLGLLFIWMFATALRAPTSFVAIAPERTRVRFAGFVDTVIDNGDVVGVRVVHQPFWGGLGVRKQLGGGIALLTAWGYVAELDLRRPMRVWLIPRLVPLRSTRVRLSVRHPEKLAERLAPAGSAKPAASPEPGRRRKMRQRGSRTR
jgi:hypothetical protein